MVVHNILERYKGIIEESGLKSKDSIEEIDELQHDIRDHINKLDTQLHDNKRNFMLAIRLVECFRILEWIKVCLYCGSYHAVYKELRYLIDSMIQAYYIDTNLPSASLKTKFEAFKLFEKAKRFDFIGQNLINKLENIPNQDKLREIYKELSNYVHPSYKQSLDFMEKASEKEPWDRMKENIFNEELLKKCVLKSKEVIKCFLDIDKKFESYFLEYNRS